MTVLKVVAPFGKSVFFDELPDSYLKIAYGTENELQELYCLKGTYLVNSQHSINTLMDIIPLWAEKQQQDKIAIYTQRTASENEELINKLSKLSIISKNSINGHDYWFSRGLVFCNE